MSKQKRINALTYVLLLLILLAFVGVGYLTFLYFVTSVAKNITTYNLLLVAVIAGIATFFNPCSFTFIPAYLTKYYTIKEKATAPNRILLYGVFGALGLLTFNILLGIAIAVLGIGFGKSLALAGEEPSLIVRWLRGIVGVALLYLGFSHATGRGLNLEFLERKPRTSLQKIQGPLTGIYWYGFLYNLIGIGCGGPILVALSVFAFGVGGFTSTIVAFIVYSLVMALLMIAVSVLVGFSKGTLLKKLQANTATVKKVSGVIIILVGIFLILSSLFTQIFTAILFPG